MNKYCPICGVENLEIAAFCSKCGAKFPDESIVNSTNQIPQYYNQSQPYAPTKFHKKNKPIIIGIATIAVVLMIVAAWFLVPMLNKSSSVTSNKTSAAGGPKVSFQSLVNGGNTITLPDAGKTAVYGYYYNGQKIGSVSYTAVDEEYYQGQQCLKILINGTLNMEIYNVSIGIDVTGTGYISESDSSLVHSDFILTYDSSYLSNMGINMSVDVNKATGEITSTIYSSITGSVTSTMNVNSESWESINYDDLYVGYTKTATYTVETTDVDGVTTTNGAMTIDVTGQEDVTVEKGTFENCYVIQISQDAGTSSVTQQIWLDKNGVCPKMQLGSLSTFTSVGDMTLELEEYYIT